MSWRKDTLVIKMYFTGGVDFKKAVKNCMWTKTFYSTRNQGL